MIWTELAFLHSPPLASLRVPEVVDSALPHLAISVFGAPQMMHNLYIYGSFGHVILRVDSPVLIFELYSFIRLKIHYQHNRHHRLKWEWLQ